MIRDYYVSLLMDCEAKRKTRTKMCYNLICIVEFVLYFPPTQRKKELQWFLYQLIPMVMQVCYEDSSSRSLLSATEKNNDRYVVSLPTTLSGETVIAEAK